MMTPRPNGAKHAAILLLCGVISLGAGWRPIFAVQADTPIISTPQIRAPSGSAYRDKAIETLGAQITELGQKVDKPPKDVWDKLTALSGIVSGLAVALIGFYATSVYNRRQIAAEERRKDQELVLSQINTVEKFIPHLSSREESIKEAALVAISTLGNEELAVKLATVFSGPGATSALTTMAATAGPRGAPFAAHALLEVLKDLQTRVVTVHRIDKLLANGFIVDAHGRVVTTAHALHNIPASELRARLPNKILVPVTVVAVDKLKDLALIDIKTDQALTPFNLSSSMPSSGQFVTVVFMDDNATVRLTLGTVVGWDVSLLSPRPDYFNPSIYVKDLSIVPGTSGAPVVDQEGRLLGLLQSRIVELDTVVLIPADAAFRFVEECRKGS